MATQAKTTGDWESFVRAVASDLNAGLSALELSEKYSGVEVHWTGQVREIKTADKFAPGIQLDMPHVSVALSNGRFLIADYLFLNVGGSGKGLWKTVTKGQKISFSAKIRSGGTVFPSIDVETFPNNAKSVLSLALEDGVPT